MEIDYEAVSRSLATRIAQATLESEQFRNIAEMYVKLYEKTKEELDSKTQELDALRAATPESDDTGGPENV